MRARLAVLLAALAAALPAAALAQPRPATDTGLALGVRAGYGVPFGDIAKDGAILGDVVDGKVPIWLELGYRFTPRVRGELFLELSPAYVAGGACASGADCSASDVRFGLAVQFHLAPAARLDPWIGVGFGVEVLNAEYDDPDPLAPPGRIEWSWAGVELPLLEGGVEYAVTERFSLGPYVSVSFGQFTSVSEKPPGGTTTSGSIDDRATHGWLQGGLKATLRL